MGVQNGIRRISTYQNLTVQVIANLLVPEKLWTSYLLYHGNLCNALLSVFYSPGDIPHPTQCDMIVLKLAAQDGLVLNTLSSQSGRIKTRQSLSSPSVIISTQPRGSFLCHCASRLFLEDFYNLTREDKGRPFWSASTPVPMVNGQSVSLGIRNIWDTYSSKSIMEEKTIECFRIYNIAATILTEFRANIIEPYSYTMMGVLYSGNCYRDKKVRNVSCYLSSVRLLPS